MICFNINRIIVYLVFIASFTISLEASSQNKIDSLEQLLIEQESDSIRVVSHIKIAEKVGESNLKKTIDHFNKAISIAQGMDNNELLAFAHYRTGTFYYRKDHCQIAIKHLKIALKIYIEFEDHIKVAQIYSRIGRSEYNIGQYTDAIDNYLKGLKIYEDNNIKNEDLGWLLRFIGSVFKRQENYPKALNYYQKSLKVFEDLDKVDGIVSCYNNIGIIYGRLEDNQKRIEYYSKALKISKKHNLDRIKSILFNLGNVMLNQGNYEEALKYYNEAYGFSLNDQDYSSMSGQLAAIANVYLKQKKYDLSIKKFKQAEEYALKSESKQLIELRYIYLRLSNIYEERNDTKKAFKYYKSYQVLKDSLSNQQNDIAISELVTKYDAEKEEQKFVRLSLEKSISDKELILSKQKERVQLLLIILIGVLSLLIIGSLMVIYKRRVRKHKEDAELHLMKKKIVELERNQLENQLSFKRKDLTKFALDISSKHEFIEQMLEKLSSLQKSGEIEVKHGLRELVQFTKGQIDINKNLKYFNENIELVNSEFIGKLKKDFPELTKNEILLCGFLRINMSSKEIASLRNITPNATKMGIYRLRKKLNLKPEQNLGTFLQNY